MISASFPAFRVLFMLAFCLALMPAPGQAASPVTDWQEVTLTGMRGVSLAVTELPQGGWYSYRMDIGWKAARSTDGINWDPLEGFSPPPNPPPPGNNTNPWVFLLADGRYRMIYEQQDDQQNRRLFSAISSDGLSFANEGQVMAGSQEDQGPEGNMFLSVPCGPRLPDGSLRMYFVSQGDKVASALSHDEGLTWQREPGYRLDQAVDPAVLALPGGGFRLFYTDWSDAFRVRRVGYADSLDGLAFVHQEWVVTVGGAGSMVDPEVLAIGDPAAGGRMVLYFSMGDDMENIDIYRAFPPEGWSLEPYPRSRP